MSNANARSQGQNSTSLLLVVLFVGALVVSCTGCGAQLSQGAISDSEAEALQSFPHESFNEVLQEHVDTEGRVTYGKLKAEPARLKKYTATVAVVGPKTYPKLFPSREHDIAYYINAYNSIAILNVLGRYPGLKSLDDVKTDFFYLTNIVVGGDETDLYNFENDIIRPALRKYYVGKKEGVKFGRIHFALNCASSSCPKLPNEAFTPERVDEQLDRETRRFVMEKRNVSVDDDAKTVTLSRIFDWYKEDFTDNNGKTISQLKWINEFRPEDAQLDTSYKIKFFNYDWTVNDEKLQR